MPDNNFNTVAGVRWAVLPPTVAANHQPAASAGYRLAGSRLYYVTERGDTWLLRGDDGRVQLKPEEPPHDAIDVNENDIDDIAIATVAEAADSLSGSMPPGIYLSSGLYYVVKFSGVWMLYGDALHAVLLPALPACATRVDVVPEQVTLAVNAMKEVG